MTSPRAMDRLQDTGVHRAVPRKVSTDRLPRLSVAPTTTGTAVVEATMMTAGMRTDPAAETVEAETAEIDLTHQPVVTETTVTGVTLTVARLLAMTVSATMAAPHPVTVATTDLVSGQTWARV